jgi:hypothetical protein
MSHLSMTRSVASRLDPALLGRLDLVFVAAAVLPRLLLPVGVVQVRGWWWNPAMLLARWELGELDDELELSPASVGRRGSAGGVAGVGTGRFR